MKKHVIRLRFPCNVEQVGANEIEVATTLTEEAILRSDAMDIIAPDLSNEAKDKLSDDIHTFAFSEGLRRSIHIVV